MAEDSPKYYRTSQTQTEEEAGEVRRGSRIMARLFSGSFKR
jgi:hypothetical protein